MCCTGGDLMRTLMLPGSSRTKLLEMSARTTLAVGDARRS